MCTNSGSGDTKQDAHQDILAVCVWSGDKQLTNVAECGVENKITSKVSEPELAKICEELAGYMIEGEPVCFEIRWFSI